jgi:hypothetical protein
MKIVSELSVKLGFAAGFGYCLPPTAPQCSQTVKNQRSFRKIQ